MRLCVAINGLEEPPCLPCPYRPARRRGGDRRKSAITHRTNGPMHLLPHQSTKRLLSPILLSWLAGARSALRRPRHVLLRLSGMGLMESVATKQYRRQTSRSVRLTRTTQYSHHQETTMFSYIRKCFTQLLAYLRRKKVATPTSSSIPFRRRRSHPMSNSVAANRVGIPYSEPKPWNLPPEYFWKQDEGAVSAIAFVVGAKSRAWRIYKRPAGYYDTH